MSQNELFEGTKSTLAVPKLYQNLMCFDCGALPLSEKQIPQLVVNTEK